MSFNRIQGEEMKIKTSELIGPALDWAVAVCEGKLITLLCGVLVRNGPTISPTHADPLVLWHPQTDWSQGGPIIEREKIDIGWVESNWREIEGCWAGTYMTKIRYARTPLIAAMRCYVASKLGNEVEVPDELTKGN